MSVFATRPQIHKAHTSHGRELHTQTRSGGLGRLEKSYLNRHSTSCAPAGGDAFAVRLKCMADVLRASNVLHASRRRCICHVLRASSGLPKPPLRVLRAEMHLPRPARQQLGGFGFIYNLYQYLHVCVPDGEYAYSGSEKFVVFNIYMAGRHLCARRYREFSNLHNNLKREFMDFNFPKLPGKWPFSLSEQQLDGRRRGLELYLEKVCAVRVIAESDIMQDFLNDSDDHQGNSIRVDLKVLLPDKTVVTVTQAKNVTASHVYNAVVDKINLSPETAKCFALFEIVEYNFERKICDDEFPHNLYIQNYSTATATCLCIHRWLFNPQRELRLCSSDDVAHTWLFWTAVEDVNRGHVKPTDQLYQLKALQDVARKDQYLQVVRGCEGYGDIVFPHCPCDSRKKGHVVAFIGHKSFRLQACKEDGTLQTQIIDFQWSTIEKFEIDDEAMAFCFLYRQTEDLIRWVKIFTPYYQFMAECFQLIQEE
ncbi:unnamed protein product, partial [Meganyctiphanes norvegica]